MLTFIKDCVTEEWQKTTIIGKVTWVPLFTILSTTALLIFVLMIPLFMLADRLEPPMTRCLRRFKRVLFKWPNSTSADQAQEEHDNELPGALALALHVREGKWPHTMDAQVWAEKWLETLAEHPDIATDEGAMIGWFANAIMAGYDHAQDDST